MIRNLLKKTNIYMVNPDYYFFKNLDINDYPKYLKKIFEGNTGEKLPLKFDWLKSTREIDKNKCKTFNQKLQWIKLYGVTQLMRDCTDKVKVREYVRERIGEEYLKPVLQVCNDFDEIDFDKLPNQFVIKCNHGCKWHYVIKNKEKFLEVENVIGVIKSQITDWLSKEFCYFAGLELQYKGIKPKILTEPLLREETNTPVKNIEVYCFKGEPKYIIKFADYEIKSESLYDCNFIQTQDLLFKGDGRVEETADETIKKSAELSGILSKDFDFVRVDWMLYKNNIYFEELTFTPYSGFNKSINPKYNKEFGKLLKLGK